MKNIKISLYGCLDRIRRLFFVALLSVLAMTANAQSKTVSGTVVDKTGETIIGASVVVKGTTSGTITDIDGNFTLSGVPSNGTIQISFVGYKMQTISVTGKTTLHVVLEEDSEMLAEVEVVAYGVQKKVTVTGALSSVKSDDLVRTPVSSVNNVLAGQLSGVTTVQLFG